MKRITSIKSTHHSLLLLTAFQVTTLRICKKLTRHSLPDIIELNENLQDATDGESVAHKKSQRSRVHLSAMGEFRRPFTMTLINHVSRSKEKATNCFHHLPL